MVLWCIAVSCSVLSCQKYALTIPARAGIVKQALPRIVLRFSCYGVVFCSALLSLSKYDLTISARALELLNRP